MRITHLQKLFFVGARDFEKYMQKERNYFDFERLSVMVRPHS